MGLLLRIAECPQILPRFGCQGRSYWSQVGLVINPLEAYIPLGEGEGWVALNETVLPLKHTDWSSGEPPKELQKSLWDCHASVSFDGELGGGAVPCKGGWKGEFVMLTSLQVSQTSLQ